MKLVIVGAGGHGRVVADAVREMRFAHQDIALVGFIDNARAPGTVIDGISVLGKDEDLPGLITQGAVTHFAMGLGSVRGGASTRHRLFDWLLATGLAPFSVIHPSAIIADGVRVGGGSVVMAGAVLQTGVEIGANVIVNTRAGIDHDCKVGDGTHIAPGATLSGDVVVGPMALVGAGAVVCQGISIGNGATVGAGAAVLGDIEPNAVVVGVPARLVST